MAGRGQLKKIREFDWKELFADVALVLAGFVVAVLIVLVADLVTGELVSFFSTRRAPIDIDACDRLNESNGLQLVRCEGELHVVATPSLRTHVSAATLESLLFAGGVEKTAPIHVHHVVPTAKSVPAGEGGGRASWYATLLGFGAAIVGWIRTDRRRRSEESARLRNSRRWALQRLATVIHLVNQEDQSKPVDDVLRKRLQALMEPLIVSAVSASQQSPDEVWASKLITALNGLQTLVDHEKSKASSIASAARRLENLLEVTGNGE